MSFKSVLFLAVSVFGLFFSGFSAWAGNFAPVSLRCEYLENPDGIDRLHPRLGWKMPPAGRKTFGRSQSAYQILVATSPDRLTEAEADCWNSGRVDSSVSIQVAYDGVPLQSGRLYYWTVRVWDEKGNPSRWSLPARWSMGLLEPADWSARWIGDAPDTAQQAYRQMLAAYDPASGKPLDNTPPPSLPSPMLRKSFVVNGSVKRAVLYVTALGYYEMGLNGEKVGDRLLTPEWTDYNQRVLYQTYDLTGRVRTGENVLSGLLGDGWYLSMLGPVKWHADYPRRGVYGNDRRLLAQLVIEKEDGTRQTVVTDGSWKIRTDGFIRSSDNFRGETIDAGRVPAGWDRPGFDDGDWPAVYVDTTVRKHLEAQRHQPIRATETLKPVRIDDRGNGVYIVDFGQNIAGWCRLSIRGNRGDTVTVRHGEMLTESGDLYTENLASAIQTDRFILSGGDDVFEPRFTYHGFQFVELSGMSEAPDARSLEAVVVGSDAPWSGTFTSSNEMLNRLFRNICWSQRGNMHGVPTDCPQRDERMGWMGDALVFGQNSMFNMDMAAFYTKWLQDVREAQGSDGAFPDIAPHPDYPDERFRNAAGWADAGIVLPWNMYLNYGDTTLLREHYRAMTRYVDNLLDKNPGLLRVNDLGNQYGDWLNASTIAGEAHLDKAGVPQDVFATAFFARSAGLLSRIAALIGEEADAERYAELHEGIRAAFIRAFVAPDGVVKGDTQSAYALALQFDLLPEELREAAFRHLLRCLEEYDWRISTGFICTPLLMQELAEQGRTDVAYRLLESERFPSWFYSILQGATTIWERWDAYVKGRGFQNAGMNSFNHYSIGAVGEWMYRHILGINPDEERPGYARFVLRPRPGGSLTWAEGSYESMYGTIAVWWDLSDEQFTYSAVIPSNTSATVVMPTDNPESIRINGKPAARTAQPDTAVCAGATAFRLPAGTYRFEVNLR